MIREALAKRPVGIVLFILIFVILAFVYSYLNTRPIYGHDTLFENESRVVLSCNKLCEAQQQCGVNTAGLSDVYTNMGGLSTIGNNWPIPHSTVVTIKSMLNQQMYSQATREPRAMVHFYEVEYEGGRSWVAGWCVAGQ